MSGAFGDNCWCKVSIGGTCGPTVKPRFLELSIGHDSDLCMEMEQHGEGWYDYLTADQAEALGSNLLRLASVSRIRSGAK